ncbi:MAG: DUF6528 family protein [Mucilaginibacter sp.]|uniref:DUF6528 family protein n=1 Tax=Mucilaginibacter sp. TaxID=1882438 RepID=UPI0031A1BA59
MKKTILFLCTAILLGACTKDNKMAKSKDNNLLAGKAKTESVAVADDWVSVTNQATGKIEIYDPAVADWDSATALKWSWKPTAAEGYSSYALTYWDVPNDFRVRTISAWGGNWLVSCASGGLVTIASYPAGVKRWAYNVGATVHPHSVELLPNGNIAVACTDQDSVKVFGSSSSATDNITHASFHLVGAHSVLWDPNTSTLRAIGNDHIVALTVGGTSSPTISENVAQRGYLVAGGASVYGHDLSSDPNDPNILWCSTNGGVYKFDKTTLKFTGAPGTLNKSFVKSISIQHSGISVSTRPDSEKSPMPANPVLTPAWCTRLVDFYSADGIFQYSRTVSGGKFYKAKVFKTPY